MRKFFCINTECKRRIFTERLASVTAPWARRTLRLAQRLTDIGLALGGAAGVRLSKQLGVTACRNTLLKLVRSIPLPPVVTPPTLGVDDFCFRSGKTYGTALIDLERRRPIALLKDAKAETLAEWLKAHPALKAVDEAYSLSSVTQTDGTVVVRVPRPTREQQALQLAEQSRARPVAIHQQVWDLHNQS
ncbi:hypothetical protein [Scytonema sp. NUACC26]|uniref:hypothetical protein n=1 Tax=Scytonema sp. NUACC26 TaxID=3140176 RepID=UPI0034DC25CF